MPRVRIPSPATGIALVALMFSLGGTSYAVTKLPKASVGATQLRTDAVTSAKVRDGSLLARDFKAGVLKTAVVQAAAGTDGLAGPTGPAGPAGRDGAGLAASAVFGDVTLNTGTWQTIGQLEWTQPANTLEDIRGYFGVPVLACGNPNQGFRYQIIVDGRELSVDADNGTPDDTGVLVPTNLGVLAPPDPQPFAAELPLEPAPAAQHHVLELRAQRGACEGGKVHLDDVRMYVTRFVAG